MGEIDRWLEIQNERVRAFVAQIEAAGNTPQVVTLVFDRPEGVPLDEPVHMQRVATVRSTEDVDALVRSAWADVMSRDMGANYPHIVHEARSLGDE
ncbi:MAG: hypothetical protein M0R75_06980 [Dehalococcoidia bacterium]|nr:hypothetical protein [Dehalococcoidia bacterium]